MGFKYKIVKPPRTGRSPPAPSAVTEQDGPKTQTRLRSDKAKSSLSSQPPTPTATTRPKKRVRIRSPSPPPVPRRRASLKASTLIKKDARRRLGSGRLFQSRVSEDGDVHELEDDSGEEEGEGGRMGDTIVVAAPKLMLLLRAKQRAHGAPRPAVIHRRRVDSSDSSSSSSEDEAPTVLPPAKRRKIVILRPPRRENAVVREEAVGGNRQSERTDATPKTIIGGRQGQDKYTPPPTPPIKEALLVGQPAVEAEGEKIVVADWGCPSPPAEVEVDGEAPWLDESALHDEPGFFLEAFGDVTGMDDDGSVKKWKPEEEESSKDAKRQKVDGVAVVEEVVVKEVPVVEEAVEDATQAKAIMIPEDEEEEVDEVDMVKVPDSPPIDVPIPAVEKVTADVTPSSEDSLVSIPEPEPQILSSVENDAKETEEDLPSVIGETTTLPLVMPIDDEDKPENATSSTAPADHSLTNIPEPFDTVMSEEPEMIEEAPAPPPHVESASVTPEPEPIRPFSPLTKATDPSSNTSTASISPIQPFFHPLAKEPIVIDLTMTDDPLTPALPSIDLTMTDNPPTPAPTTTNNDSSLSTTSISPSQPPKATDPTDQRQSYDSLLSHLSHPTLKTVTTSSTHRRSSLPAITPAPSMHRTTSLPLSFTPTYKEPDTAYSQAAALRRQTYAVTKARQEIAGQEGRLVVIARNPAAGLPEEGTAPPRFPPSLPSITIPTSPAAPPRKIHVPPPPPTQSTTTHPPPLQPTKTHTKPPPLAAAKSIPEVSSPKRKRGRPPKLRDPPTDPASLTTRRRLVPPIPILPHTHMHTHTLPYQHSPPPLRSPGPSPGLTPPPILLLPAASPTFPKTTTPWAYRRNPTAPLPRTQGQTQGYLADKWLVAVPVPQSAPISPVSPTSAGARGDREKMPPPPLPAKARVAVGVGATVREKGKGGSVGRVTLPGLEALGEERVTWSKILAPIRQVGRETGKEMEKERISVASLLN